MENIKYDVFLSRKSEDAHLAKEIYDFLTEKGLKVFDSDISLPQIGNSDYRKKIDEALDSTTHLIVIGSNVKNISSSWVEAEWGFFIQEKRSGYKDGNILTIVKNEVILRELPPSLRYYEVLQLDNSNLDKILAYVKKSNIGESGNNEIPQHKNQNLEFIESESYNIFLESVGPNKLSVVKLVKDYFRIGLKEAKDLVDKQIGLIGKDFAKNEAIAFQKEISLAGGEIHLIESSNTPEFRNKTYSVYMLSIGPSKLSVVKGVKDLFNVGLSDAKNIVDNCSPKKPLKDNLDKSDAENIYLHLKLYGADLQIVEHRH